MQRDILLVEDDDLISSGLKWALRQEGYGVTLRKTAKEAQHALEVHNFDLIILDLNLPDGTGFDVQEFLTRTNKSTEVLFLTAVDDKVTAVRALEQGAADYVTKPFDIRELLARIVKALPTRNHSNESKNAHHKNDHGQHTASAESDEIIIGNLRIDTLASRAYIKGEVLKLTMVEYRILELFAQSRGRLLSRTEIIDKVWQDAHGYIEDNTLSTYVRDLRKKLNGELKIETVRGVGYRVD